MTYTNFVSTRSLFFTLSIASVLVAGSACGGGEGAGDSGPRAADTGNGADAPGLDAPGLGLDAPGLDAPGLDASCMIECAAPPFGCHYDPPPAGECSCGTLVCEDAGTEPGADAWLPPGACRVNADCDAGQFCAGTGCDTDGVCEPMPATCGEIFAPVCGCDGNTYDNACSASAAGVRVASEGMCGSSGGCMSNADCNPAQYCAGTGCDTPGTCVVRPDICRDIYSPVCGCDGATYSNDCYAAGAGVRVGSVGECSSGTCSPPCAPGQTCSLCRGPGGGVWVCLPPGTVC
ncbi:MAG: Kazal-type serine protease inhibitor domain-containing protein [Sandaracinus sp.]